MQQPDAPLPAALTFVQGSRALSFRVCYHVNGEAKASCFRQLHVRVALLVALLLTLTILLEPRHAV